MMNEKVLAPLHSSLIIPRSSFLLCRAVLLEPGLQTVPAVGRGLLVVGGAVVGVEAVARVGVDDYLRLARGLRLRGFERGPHLLDRLLWDALILRAVEAEYGRVQLVHEVNRLLRRERARLRRRVCDESAVPRDGRVQLQIGRAHV